MPEGQVRAAWFETVISCELGTGIAGYDGADVAQAKLDDLMLTGLCLDDGDLKALILSFDLLYFDSGTVRRYRRFAAEKLGMREDAVLVTCSHTHGGPHTRAYEKGHGEDDEFLLPAAADHLDAKYVRWLDATVEKALADFAAKPENLVAAGGYEPQYQQFLSRDTLRLVTEARDALFEVRSRAFPEDNGGDGYPDNQNLPLVNLPGGVKASKWQK